MAQTRPNFDPSTGDDTSAALRKLDNNCNDLDTRLVSVKATADGATTPTALAAAVAPKADKSYVDTQDALKLPVANPVFTGSASKKGVQNQFNYQITNAAGEIGIGGNFGDWSGNRTPALQVDAMVPTAAFMPCRVTQWGSRNLWGMDVYAGGTTTSQVVLAFHFDTGIQKHQFFSNGAATFAGALTQNSDYRIKEEKRQIDPADAAVGLRAARPIEYRDIRDAEDAPERAGYIAHEFQACFPLLVHGEKDATEWSLAYDGDTTPYPPGEEPEGWVQPTPYPVRTAVLQNVDYIGQVPYLTAGWQEHDARIAELEAKLAAALERLAALEGGVAPAK